MVFKTVVMSIKCAQQHFNEERNLAFSKQTDHTIFILPVLNLDFMADGLNFVLLRCHRIFQAKPLKHMSDSWFWLLQVLERNNKKRSTSIDLLPVWEISECVAFIESIAICSNWFEWRRIITMWICRLFLNCYSLFRKKPSARCDLTQCNLRRVYDAITSC